MINVQTFVRIAKHLTHDIPNPFCAISQCRRHPPHAQTPTLRQAKFQKLLLVRYRRKCRNHRRFRQYPGVPLRRECTQTTLTLRKSTHLNLHPFRQTCKSANVNESTIGIKFGLAFRLLKVMANVRMACPSFGNFFGGMTGNFSERGVRQMNTTEFFEAFGGKTVRPKTAATSCVPFQSIGVILV